MLNRGVVIPRTGSGNQRVAQVVLEDASLKPFEGDGELTSVYMVVTVPFQNPGWAYPYLGIGARINHPDGGHDWFRALRMRGTLSLDFHAGNQSPAEAWRSLSSADWFPALSITVSIVALNRDLEDEPVEQFSEYIETDGMLGLKLPAHTGRVLATYRCLTPGWPVHKEGPNILYGNVDQTTGTVYSADETIFSQVQGFHAERLVDIDMDCVMSDLQNPTFAVYLQYRANNNITDEEELRNYINVMDYRVTFNGTLFGYPDY